MTDQSARGQLTHGFLFADLRGYTAFAEARGDSAAADLLDRYRALVRRVVSTTDGVEIKTEGDSFYLVFPSASRAVSAGLAIVAAAAESTATDPAHPIRVGIGIHAGEAEERPDGYVGSAVNLAARVCSVAEPGEVLVTDMVRGLTRSSGRYRFSQRGRRNLKGIAEPVTLFRADPSDDAVVVRSRRPNRGLALVGGTLAVGVVLVVAGTIAMTQAPLAALPPAGSASMSDQGGQTPTPAGQGSGQSARLPISGGRNTPGVHCSTTFTPRICLTFPAGWSGVSEIPNEILLTNQPSVLDQSQGVAVAAPIPELGARWQSVTISRPSLFVVPCSSYKPIDQSIEPLTTTIGPTPQDFIDQLRSSPALIVREPVPARVGVADAIAIDVVRAETCGGHDTRIVYLDSWTRRPDGTPLYNGFAAVSGAWSRVFVLGHVGQTIVIVVTGPTEKMEEFLNTAMAVLVSLTFEP